MSSANEGKIEMSIFLDQDDIEKLTGRKRKSDQIQWLNMKGIQFYINASNRPVVPRSAIDGKIESASNIADDWKPAVINK